MRNKRTLNDIFDFIEITIDLNNKLYKRVIKKQFNQSYKRAKIFFELTMEYSQKKSYSNNQKYNNLDYCRSISMKLNFTQRRKEKNSREKQDNKNSKTYYICDKSNYFARDCCSKNLIILR